MRLSRESIVTIVGKAYDSTYTPIIVDDALKTWEAQIRQLKWQNEKLEKEISDLKESGE
jgi:cell division protein FtsB